VSDLAGKRYGEVLLVTRGEAGPQASVYNSFPLNDCPAELWSALGRHRAHLETTGGLVGRRTTRAREELRTIVTRTLEHRVLGGTTSGAFDRLLDDVLARRLDPYSAADRLLDDLE